MKTTFTTQTYNDAGLLRAYIAERFGQGFEYGMSPDRYHRAIRLSKRLATLAGLSLETVIETAKTDAAILYA